MKGNHGSVYAAVVEWVQAHNTRAPDGVLVDKAHGREERQEIWVAASWALGEYLARGYGWVGMSWRGRVRRCRRRIGQAGWQDEEEVFWLAGGQLPAFDAQRALAWLRDRWEIENRIFWVRDAAYAEDRCRAHAAALALSSLRTAALNLIRRLGFRFIPDGWRALATRPDRGLTLLLYPLDEVFEE